MYIYNYEIKLFLENIFIVLYVCCVDCYFVGLIGGCYYLNK